MNIFVTDRDPALSATSLPDKHVVKMPLESCQMLSIVYSKWYYDWGSLCKKDGTNYRTEHGAFRNHPCTQWVSKSVYNTAWLIAHGKALCAEYTYRYGKDHSCLKTIVQAEQLFMARTCRKITCHTEVDNFTRAMPDVYKLNETIDTPTAYKLYIASKPWVKDNYLRKPDRKPKWV
jgi:hypothetical protein